MNAPSVAEVRENVMPPNRVILAAARRLQQAYDLNLPGRPAPDLTVAAPSWDSLDGEEQGEWLTLARVAHGVEA